MNDSDIRQQLAALPDDYKRVDVMNEIAYSHRYSNPFATFELGQHASLLAETLQYANGMAEGLRLQGLANIIMANYVQSLHELQRAYSLYNETGHKPGLVSVTANLGLAYQRMGQYDLALEWLNKSLALSEEIKDDMVTSNNLGNIAIVYSRLKKYDLALSYYEKTMTLKQRLGDEPGVAECLSAVGDVYEKLGELSDAYEFQQKALDFARSSAQKMAAASILRSMGRIQQQQKEYGRAMQSFMQAHELLEEIRDRQQLAEFFNEMAYLYLERGSFAEALNYAKRSLDLAVELGSKEAEFAAHLSQSKIYEATEDYKNALEHYKRYTAIESETFQKTASQQMEGMQMRLDFEKSEREKELMRLRNEELDQALNDIRQKALLIEEKNRDITSSINYARRIQQAILPQLADVQEIFPNSFIYYKPKDIVCGDFYWALNLGNITLAAAVDCTGHGVPAALMSIIGYNLLNDIVVNRGINEPSKILSALHNGVRAALKQDAEEGQINMDGMDIVLCSFDKQRHEVQFAGAFSSLFVMSRGQVEEIKGDKYPIGGIQDEMFRIYTNHRINLTGNETFYLCSDGFANQVGGETAKRYNSKRLKDFIATLRAVPLPEQKELFEKELADYSAGYEQMDDILVFAIRP